MIKKRRTYQPRVFDGRIITSDEIERIATAAVDGASDQPPLSGPGGMLV
jgi:hypothetical protein